MRPDSRIEDVLHTLADPEEFVRGILGSFVGFSKDEAVMRIGISGSGTAPHYCIEQGRNAVKSERPDQ
jgi:nicotinic acid phosphoribosyltransferase